MRLLAMILFALVLAPSWAWAQSCSFSVTNINFANVDTLSGAAADTTGTVNLTCSSGLLTNLRVCVNIGAGSGGATSGIRHLRNAANVALDYNLYRDSARTIPWGSAGDTTLGSAVAVDFVQILGSVAQSRTIYARVFGGQESAPTGLYTSNFSGAQVNFTYATYLILTGPPPCSSITQSAGSASFSVQASVMANCSVTAQDINFGSRGVLDSNVDATGGVDVTCTPGTTYNIGLNNGLNGDGPAMRRMVSAGEAVLYGLYRDAARSQPWGDTIGADTATGTGAGADEHHTVFGRVPPQTTPSPGTYSDTVVVTVTY